MKHRYQLFFIVPTILFLYNLSDYIICYFSILSLKIFLAGKLSGKFCGEDADLGVITWSINAKECSTSVIGYSLTESFQCSANALNKARGKVPVAASPTLAPTPTPTEYAVVRTFSSATCDSSSVITLTFYILNACVLHDADQFGGGEFYGKLQYSNNLLTFTTYSNPNCLPEATASNSTLVALSTGCNVIKTGSQQYYKASTTGFADLDAIEYQIASEAGSGALFAYVFFN